MQVICCDRLFYFSNEDLFPIWKGTAQYFQCCFNLVVYCFEKVTDAGHRRKAVLQDPDAHYFGRTLISKKKIKMPFCNVNFYSLCKGIQPSFVPMMWGPIQSPLDSVGDWNRPCGADFLTLEDTNLELCHSCIHQEHSSGEDRAGSGPWAATGWERLLEMQTRLVVRAALPALAVAVPSAAASTIVLAEGDAGSYRKKNKGKFFLLPPHPPPAPWKCRMHFVNSKRLQSNDGYFPFPCLWVKREFIVK